MCNQGNMTTITTFFMRFTCFPQLHTLSSYLPFILSGQNKAKHCPTRKCLYFLSEVCNTSGFGHSDGQQTSSVTKSTVDSPFSRLFSQADTRPSEQAQTEKEILSPGW